MDRVCSKWVQGPFPLSLSNVGSIGSQGCMEPSQWIIWKRQDCLAHQWLFNRHPRWETTWDKSLYFVCVHVWDSRIHLNGNVKFLCRLPIIHGKNPSFSSHLLWCPAHSALPWAHERSLPGFPPPKPLLLSITLKFSMLTSCHWEWGRHPLKERLLQLLVSTESFFQALAEAYSSGRGHIWGSQQKLTCNSKSFLWLCNSTLPLP